ncbi:MAG TPA: hypothetical protein VL689_14300 [Paraburkholderia sp.]|nr:hypothetical protein [Paraburkholderia sp.]
MRRAALRAQVDEAVNRLRERRADAPSRDIHRRFRIRQTVARAPMETPTHAYPNPVRSPAMCGTISVRSRAKTAHVVVLSSCFDASRCTSGRVFSFPIRSAWLLRHAARRLVIRGTLRGIVRRRTIRSGSHVNNSAIGRCARRPTAVQPVNATAFTGRFPSSTPSALTAARDCQAHAAIRAADLDDGSHLMGTIGYDTSILQ